MGKLSARRARGHHDRALGQSGEIFVGDNASGRVRRVKPAPLGVAADAAFRIPSPNGAEIYEVDAKGRHLRTLSGLTGAPLLAFSYDSANLLSTIHDPSGLETRITRTPSTITITAPHGQVTRLALDAAGHLTSITNPAGEVTGLAHTPTGLLTTLTDPRGLVQRFDYDLRGRLTKDTNALPGSEGIRLSSIFYRNGWDVDLTSPEGRVTRYATRTAGAFPDNAVKRQRFTTIAPFDGC